MKTLLLFIGLYYQKSIMKYDGNHLNHFKNQYKNQ